MSRASRPRGVTPTLTAHWARITPRLRSARRVIVFLDFDGTLVDIAPLPTLVRLKPAARRALRRLARNPRVTIVVISGRRRFELQRYIGLPGVRHFGLYGWERNSSPHLPKAARTALQAARKAFGPYLVSVPGAWIEDKRFSFSIHLLDVPQHAQRRARRELDALLQPFRKHLRLMQNLREAEVVPRCIQGKGDAVRQFLAQPAHRGALPFYFGDDLSDESAFDAIDKGVSVLVGAARPTRARYSVRNPAALAGILVRIDAALARSTP